MTQTDMNIFYDSVTFLKNHRIFGGRFWEGLDIAVVKVDPATERIEDDATRNTSVRVWLEAGPLNKDKSLDIGPMHIEWCHDPRLDCGGNSFEEATIRLAANVRKYYRV